MNHPSHPSRNSMSWDILTFGNEGIELSRSFERRAEEQVRNRLAASLESSSPRRPLRPLRPLRSWIGAMLITAGRAIAGAAPVVEPDVTGHGAA